MSADSEYYDFLLNLVRNKEIGRDPTLLYVTIGKIIFFMRADTLPLSEQIITDQFEIEDGLWEETENGNWSKK